MINKTKIGLNDRLEFLPNYFGVRCIKFEALVYGFMGQFCEAYQGGLWDFYTLDNGGMYIALDQTETVRICNPMNYFDDDISAEAAGIGVTLFALNVLMEAGNQTQIIDLYYALRDFAVEHDEGGKIMGFID